MTTPWCGSDLEQLLGAADGIEVVGTAGDGREALKIVQMTSPDVVLMDLQMPDVDGVTATRRIVAANSDVQVVVLTSFSDSERIVAALDAGAIGYLLKDAEPEDLLEGVRAAARGESPLHPRAARQLLTARSAQRGGQVDLTPREAEVLGLVRQGLANKQIARRLGHQRTHRQGAPHLDLPTHRRRRPHAGGPLGRTPRRQLTANRAHMVGRTGT